MQPKTRALKARHIDVDRRKDLTKQQKTVKGTASAVPQHKSNDTRL